MTPWLHYSHIKLFMCDFRALSPIVPMSISLSHREQRHFCLSPLNSLSQGLYDSWESHLAEKLHLFSLILRKKSVVVKCKIEVDRESCKRCYFPYYCVLVRYCTKVTVDSSAASINIPTRIVLRPADHQWAHAILIPIPLQLFQSLTAKLSSL